MYSPEITERRLFAAKRAGLKYKRYPRETSIEVSRELERLRYDERGNLLPDGGLVRDLDSREREFIDSERILCKADFEYYLTRYHTVERDPGVGTESGNGPAKLLESQRLFIHRLGQREQTCYDEHAKYGHTAGILAIAHKCRQVAFTATSRGASIHRMLFYPGTRAFAATLKDGPQGTGELYSRDLLTIDSLPFWLAPEISSRVKDEEISFASPIKSRLSYQAENQQTGIGTGTQQDVSHLTEVPLWSHPGRIRYSFYPALPKAVTTLHIQEGTSAGKGDYWHEVSEGCRHHRPGFEDWIYIFVPWYINTTKYRSIPPYDWSPKEHTIQHAALVERTSPEFNEGRIYQLTVEQMHWWETTRELHAHTGELASFLANYPATPEQSFTNWAQGALPIELLEKMELETREPVVYEIEVERTATEATPQITPSDTEFPHALYVGGSSVKRYTAEDWEEIARDPRGLLLMWEPPRQHARYVMAHDPTVGVTGWTRATRTSGDHKTDNGAIEIFRLDGRAEPQFRLVDGQKVPDIDPTTQQQRILYRDVQVAEYFAPCDAVESARICNILGRIYHGLEDDMCEFIWEAYPGPGLLTTQEMIRLGYGNLWHWQHIDREAQDTNQLGWHSGRESQRTLWYRSRRHLLNRQVLIRSQFLVAEYSNAEIDLEKMRARAASGYHDDLFQAANMAFWAGHKWTYDIERVEQKVTTVAVMDYQRYAPTLDDGGYQSYNEWREAATADWEDD